MLSVGVGEDSRARKEIRRAKKIHSLEKWIGRCYSPTHLEEITLPKAGEVVATGTEENPKAAREAGNATAWAHVDGGRVVDTRRCPEGYRVQCFPERGPTGKSTGRWEWRVLKEREDGERKVLRKRLKFPGYLVIHIRITPDSFHLVRSCRGVEGFLMSDENPTPLASEEAALLLIQQAAANKAAKEVNKKVELPYGPGGTVRVKDGAWRDLSGKVLQVGGDEKDPQITVELTVLGRPIPVTLSHKLLEYMP